MKKFFNLIVLFFQVYGQILLENKETPYERIDRTCGSEFYL